MTKRRGHGEGGVRQRADGRWEGSIDLGRQDGRRRRKSVYGRTKTEALQNLRAEQRRVETGLPPTDGTKTVEQFLRWWLTDVLPGTVSRGSEETYRRVANLYVIPALGHIVLARLAPADVTMMMRSMERAGTGRRPLSAQTQSQARKVLSKALRRAEQEGFVARNAASLADAPRVPQRESRSLTREQAVQLVEAVEGERLGVAYALQLALGLRHGEVLGLSWSDIDLEGQPAIIRVRRQLQRTPEGLQLSELKTPKSARDLAVPPQLVGQLRTWRSLQSAEHLAAGVAWSDNDGLTFTTPIGTPIDPDNYRHGLSAITKRAGLGHWTTHELRHSAGSILFDQGVPMKLISEQLGHSSERVTSDTYVHTAQRARERSAEVMAAALWAPSCGTDEVGGGETEQLVSQIGGQAAAVPVARGA